MGFFKISENNPEGNPEDNPILILEAIRKCNPENNSEGILSVILILLLNIASSDS